MSQNQTFDPQGSDEPESVRWLTRVHGRLHANPVISLVTKVVVTIVGSVVTLVGIITLVTPGPAVVIIPLGLAILATEWHWARRVLVWVRTKFRQAQARSAALDPVVRRRRRVLSAIAVIVVVGAAAAYLYVYDWPTLAIDGWDKVQRIGAWVPELPGM